MHTQTLNELLRSSNPAIKRNAQGILSQIQKCEHKEVNEQNRIQKCLACLKMFSVDGVEIIKSQDNENR